MSWVSPLAHIDAGGGWFYPERAYDGDLTTMAYVYVSGEVWSGFLELLRPVFCNTLRVRLGSWNCGELVREMELEVNLGGWKPVYSGVFPEGIWREFIFDQGLILGARLRFKTEDSVQARALRLYELEFKEIEGRGLDALLGDGRKPRVIPYLGGYERRDVPMSER